MFCLFASISFSYYITHHWLHTRCSSRRPHTTSPTGCVKQHANRTENGTVSLQNKSAAAQTATSCIYRERFARKWAVIVWLTWHLVLSRVIFRDARRVFLRVYCDIQEYFFLEVNWMTVTQSNFFTILLLLKWEGIFELCWRQLLVLLHLQKSSTGLMQYSL